jgi:ABC-type nitrate/sulfonate/bicarbonate transport system ATPase subunit
MTDHCLRVNISSMRYPGSTETGNLIENISFVAAPPTIISFVGRSGAGKTTLLRMIAGLERRFEGEVTLGGRRITKPGRDIQIVFQDYRLLPWKTVRENIGFATSGDSASRQSAKVDKWLDIIEMKGKKDAWPKTLSGGEEGRVALARTFVSPPRVLLLDEPFRNLDLVAKFELRDELIKDLRDHEAIVILISHNIDDAVFLSDTVYLLSKAPMRIEATFDVAIDKPRQRGDPKLLELSARILEYMIGSEKGQQSADRSLE